MSLPALDDIVTHRGSTDPIEGLTRIETSPKEIATPVLLEMIRSVYPHDDVFGIFNRRLQLVAIAHLAYSQLASANHGMSRMAEFAVSVDDRARGKGFGGRLFTYAVRHARNHGVDRLFIHALSENTAMLRIARKAGADMQRDGVTSALKAAGATWDVITVPGALEIPLVLQTMSQSGNFDALVALGAVIRGETYHFELVSNESASGITRISIDSGLPIANGVLTCDTDEQAQVRVNEKGADCARAVVEMANLALALTPDIDIEINPSEA